MHTHTPNLLDSKKKMVVYQLVILVLMQLINYFVADSWWSIVWLLIGGLIGLAMLKVDELYLQNYYRTDSQDHRLITRSPLFVTVFAAVAVLVLTSSDQYVGFGVVFGLAIGLLVEGWVLSNQVADFVTYFSLTPPSDTTSEAVPDDLADANTEAETEANPEAEVSVSVPAFSNAAPASLSQSTIFRIMTGATVYTVLLFGWWVISQL